MPDYVLEGPRWTHTTITWSADSTVSGSLVPTISAAFADWSRVANVQFQQVAPGTGADITFSESSIDGHSHTLGLTNYGYMGGAFTSAHITFDSDESWHAVNGSVVSSDGANFFVTAAHEIGHALGLDHYNAGPAVMNAYLSPSVTDLTASDIHGIQAIYGAAPSAPTASAPSADVASQAIASATSPNFSHGSFDAAYYLSTNPDVAQASLGSGDTFAFAYKHYEQFGWHEGRNPNAMFDVRGYLTANRDVAAAGVDPLTHYDTFGWHEGRDPSTAFDTAQYESHYADVAAAGVNPLQHYLLFGSHEGRSTFADIHCDC